MAQSKSPHGARPAYRSVSARFHVWRSQHRAHARQSFSQLIEKPFANGVTILMLTLALLLPSLLFIGLRNVEQWINYSDNGLEVSAYLHLTASNEEGHALSETVETWEEVAFSRYVSPDQAIGLIARSSNMGDVIQSLPSNPLPPTLLVGLKGIDDIQLQAEVLAARLQEFPIVESVQYNSGWFIKAQALIGLGRQLAIGLACMLAIGVVLVVGNTIRLGIERRREEILVAKLVGATDSYVRRPFLYMASWLGLTSGSLAALLSGLCWFALTIVISPIEDAYNADISVLALPIDAFVICIFGSAFLSWLGAWLICNRHIRAIEPE